MQAGDALRIKLDDHCWSVQCPECLTWFEAQRSDATYCTPRCRKRASTANERKLSRIAELQAMGRRANQIAGQYPHSTDVFDQMVLLKQAIDRATKSFELKWDPQTLPE